MAGGMLTVPNTPIIRVYPVDRCSRHEFSTPHSFAIAIGIAIERLR